MLEQDGMSASAKEFYHREFAFFGQITNVSGKIREFELGPKRKVPEEMHLSLT